MASLSNAAEQFIVGLEKAEADLKAVAHRLEQDYEYSLGRSQQLNLCSLAQRIRRLDKALPKVKKEYEDMLVLKQSLINETKQQLLGNRELIEQLEYNSAAQCHHDTDVYNSFQCAIRQWERTSSN